MRKHANPERLRAQCRFDHNANSDPERTRVYSRVPNVDGLAGLRGRHRVGYDRDAFGSAYSSLEDEIIDGLPKSGGQVYTPYTCTLFDILADGTAATDTEHIVALAEAYDSGLAESQFRTFAGDIDNLTIADPTVNRSQKADRDAGEWGPPRNRGWFAARVVAVKRKYGLSVNPAERDVLQAMLNSDPSRTVTCGEGMTPMGGPTYYFPICPWERVGLAGVELRDGQRDLDPLAFDA